MSQLFEFALGIGAVSFCFLKKKAKDLADSPTEGNAQMIAII